MVIVLMAWIVVQIWHLQQMFQHRAVGTRPNRLGGHESGSLQLTRCDLQTRLIKPIAHQVRPTGHTACKHSVERFKVIVAQFAALLAATQKRRVANDHVGLGPSGLSGFGGLNGSFDRTRRNGVRARILLGKIRALTPFLLPC